MIRSRRRASWLLFAAVWTVGCATGVSPDTYSGVGDDGGVTADAAVGDQLEAASEGAPAEGGAGGRAPDATAQDAGSSPDASHPDAAGGEDASSSADTGQDTSVQDASADVTEADSSDEDDIDGGENPEGGTGEDSGVVCNRHTCSGCCDTSSVCHTMPSPDDCPTSFHAGGPCEDCKAEGEDYCVFDLIVYVCSSVP